MYERRSLGLLEARSAVAAVLAAITESDKATAVAVVDAEGTLLCCARQDRAASRMLRRACAKAYTSAVLGMDTMAFRDQLRETNRTLADWGDPALTTLRGGLVATAGGQVVGAIACSGGTQARGEELAGIGLAALQLGDPAAGMTGG